MSQLTARLQRAVLSVLTALTIAAVPAAAHATTFSTTPDASQQGDFNLQVTPSPLVTTVVPGVKSQSELKIRNASTGPENLKIEARSFTLSQDSSNVNLQDTTPPDISNWLSFSAPKFTIQPGQWFSEEVTFNVPKTAGFSYSFALVISRQSNPTPTGGTQAIKGSLAVFTLVNVNRPGATSDLKVASFTASKRMYEYLPATFSIRFHNDGNTILQPYGNIFVSRAGAQSPLATLTVNPNKGYILPNTTRVITAEWSDGFPVYQTSDKDNGSTSSPKLTWNWGQLSKLRIGKYTAHLVAVYNQAGRDVPIEGTVSFWVIPWKILLVLLLIVLLVLFALFVMIRSVVRFIRKRILKHGKNTPPQAPPTTPETPAKTS